MSGYDDVLAFYGLSKTANLGTPISALPSVKSLASQPKALAGALDSVAKKMARLPKPMAPKPTGPLGF